MSDRAVTIARSLTVMPPDSLSYTHFDISDDDIARLPHQPYGLVTCKFVYALIKDKPAFVKRVCEMMAPNGIFVLITPMSEDVPEKKKSIAATPETMAILSDEFEQVALYRELELTYFIGKCKDDSRYGNR